MAKRRKKAFIGIGVGKINKNKKKIKTKEIDEVEASFHCRGNSVISDGGLQAELQLHQK